MTNKKSGIIPEIFDSKIKRIQIELPHYRFNHSTDEKSHSFVGRKKILEKLKKIIENTTNKTGVYLVTGNRGVGKTSLVNQVISQTSLPLKFSRNLKYLFVLLFAVVGTQLLIDINKEVFKIITDEIIIKCCFLVLGLVMFGFLCRFNSYNYENPKLKLLDCILSAFKELSFLTNPRVPVRTVVYLLKTFFIVCFIQVISLIFKITPVLPFGIYLAIVFIFMYVRFLKSNESYPKPIRTYLKNYNRLYLRINFGHKLKDEKDILRLIARTLSTEYSKFHSSLRRMFMWRITAFVLLFFFTLFFVQGIYKYLFNNNVQNYPLYQVNYSHQVYSETTCVNQDSCKTNSKEEKNYSLKLYITERILQPTDTVINVVANYICNIPTYLWCGDWGAFKIQKKYIKLLTHEYWLTFFSIYLFCVILFRYNWLFPTHRAIKRQMKRLNRDITHSTEREIQANVQYSNISLGTKTKKSRGIADAREIEKELKDILEKVQRIPKFMCRPDIVIVFDELDKVEPGETGLEEKNSHAKTSMFSINATREKQSEILKILSNMKYFLSTVSARFIFIAGREMYDMYMADVSERSNYIGSIFNTVINVPSFLTDRPDDTYSDITSLTEEFVCRKLIPHNYRKIKCFNLESYVNYLKENIYKNRKISEKEKEREIHKIIAILQQLIIYLAHVSKGAPKKMIQLFESFIEVVDEKDKKNRFLHIQRYKNSSFFLTFDYYRQYTLGIIAYLITPIFNRLSQSNIKEHSDKLLVSSLRFVDYLFKFHKHTFSWRHLDISPEMLEINHSPELKSIAVDLLNYLTQIHINKSTFSLNDYKFDSTIANEFFAMTKTDETFSALFSFSLDEALPLKEHYKNLLNETQNDIKKFKNKTSANYSVNYLDAAFSLQEILGDLHYYDDELEEAKICYKNAIRTINLDEEKGKNLGQLYRYVRSMLKWGMVFEKRKQYDFAYLTYEEICKRIKKFKLSNPTEAENGQKTISKDDDKNDTETAFEGLKLLFLPFIAKLQILEKSHNGGITQKHIETLKNDIEVLLPNDDVENDNVENDNVKLMKADFFSRVADILYYKKSDANIIEKPYNCLNNKEKNKCDCCRNYEDALSFLSNSNDKSTLGLLKDCHAYIQNNFNTKHITVLARILSDWGNVFYSCHSREVNEDNTTNGIKINTVQTSEEFIEKCVEYLESKNEEFVLFPDDYEFDSNTDIAFAMYAISSKAYSKVNSNKRSAYQIYKMIRLFKSYKIYENNDLYKKLGNKAISLLWCATEDLNIFEYNKRKKDIGIETIPLLNLLLDPQISRIWTLVKEMELKANIDTDVFKTYYDLYITSPYGINYSISARIYLLWLKSIVNFEAYKWFIMKIPDIKTIRDYNESKEKDKLEKNALEVLQKCYYDAIGRKIYKSFFVCPNLINKIESWNKYEIMPNIELLKELKNEFYDESNKKFIQTHLLEIVCILDNNEWYDATNKITEGKTKIEIFENLLAESIFCLKEIIRLAKTIDDTRMFNHGFMGSMHDKLSFWIRRYEAYNKLKNKVAKQKELDTQEKRLKKLLINSKIDIYLCDFLGKDWEEQLSGYYESQQALSHYIKSLETHRQGRAYHDMIDKMCFIKDDYNDRSDHFNIADERHYILNGNMEGETIENKIKRVREYYKDSKLHKVDNYSTSENEND